MDDQEKKFFHILNFDFLIDTNLNVWIKNTNSDPAFVKSNNIFDTHKQKMLEDILKNASLKIVQNLRFDGEFLS